MLLARRLSVLISPFGGFVFEARWFRISRVLRLRTFADHRIHHLLGLLPVTRENRKKGRSRRVALGQAQVRHLYRELSRHLMPSIPALASVSTVVLNHRIHRLHFSVSSSLRSFSFALCGIGGRASPVDVELEAALMSPCCLGSRLAELR